MNNQKDNNPLEAIREVVSASLDAAIIIDLQERTLNYSNQVAIDLFGLVEGDSLDKVESLINIVTAPDREYVKFHYQLAGKRRSLADIEFSYSSPGNSVCWLTCSTCLFKDGRYVYATLKDITKVKQHETFLVQYGAKKNTLLDTLLHELNGALYLMNDLAIQAEKSVKVSDRKSLERFISLVSDNSNHCITIINDLLREENTDAPGIYVRHSRCDIVKVVRYIFEERRNSKANRNFILDTSATEVLLNTDEVKFLQILTNLASNAVKFTRDGDEIRFEIRDTGSSVTVAVSDNGIGIPEAMHPFVFDRYGPARRNGLNGEKSIGLGLSVCKLLTQLIGGQLTFKSTEGKGSTFTLELPKE